MDIGKYSSSPDKGSFYRSIWKKQLDEGKTTPEIYHQMIEILDNHEQSEKNIDKTSNLEYDLRSNIEILNKARNSEIYSQNIYAALCNNIFLYGDKEWSCSWRCAGGIVADMLEKGDYIDWYCSGIGSNKIGFVGESVVTDEIRLDLAKIGWTIKEDNSQTKE